MVNKENEIIMESKKLMLEQSVKKLQSALANGNFLMISYSSLVDLMNITNAIKSEENQACPDTKFTLIL